VISASILELNLIEAAAQSLASREADGVLPEGVAAPWPKVGGVGGPELALEDRVVVSVESLAGDDSLVVF